MKRLLRVMVCAIIIVVPASLCVGANTQNKGQWTENADGTWNYIEDDVPLADAHIDSWYVAVDGTYVAQREELQEINKIISSYRNITGDYVLISALDKISGIKSIIDSYIGRSTKVWYYGNSITEFYINKEDIDSLYTNYHLIGEYVRCYDNRVLGKSTERERALEIANIIIENFEYDNSLQNLTINKFISTGYGVCYNYSLLFERMCAVYGIECYEVRGYPKSMSNGTYHSWNEVVIDGVTEVWDLSSADSSGNIMRYINVEEPLKSQYYKK